MEILFLEQPFVSAQSVRAAGFNYGWAGFQSSDEHPAFTRYHHAYLALNFFYGPGQRHFVTPKAAGSFVTVEAIGIYAVDQVDFAAAYELVVLQDGQDVTASVTTAAYSTLYVKTDAAAHYVVQLRTKDAAKTVLDSLHVWVVWAEGKFTHIPDNIDTNLRPAKVRGFDGVVRDGLIFYGTNIPTDNGSGFVAQFTIQPASITDLTQDVPNLTGESDPAYPPSPAGRWPITYAHQPAYDTSLGAKNKWDASQSLRCRLANPKPIPKQYLSDYETADTQSLDLYANQPKADDLVRDFPASDVEGNDDIVLSAQQNDPYHPFTSDSNPYLNHEVGVLMWADAPALLTPGNPASDGDPANTWEGALYEQEYDLAAFVRLQIGQAWYRVSKHLNWHVTLHVSCHNGRWQDANHASQSGTSPDSD